MHDERGHEAAVVEAALSILPCWQAHHRYQPLPPSICSISERDLREIQEGIHHDSDDGDYLHNSQEEVASHKEKECAPLKRLIVQDMLHQSSPLWDSRVTLA